MPAHQPNRQRGQRNARHQRFTVRGIRREQVDMGKFSRALIGLAQAEAERQAQAAHTADEQDLTYTEVARQMGGPDAD